MTTLGTIGTVAPLVLQTGDVIEQTVDTPEGPMRFVGEVVVDGTKVTLQNVSVFEAESAKTVNLGTNELLKASRAALEGLKEAGVTEVRITGVRSAAYGTGGANPGRPVDLTIHLR